MSGHTALIEWKQSGPDFLKGQYTREHTWTFDGGITVSASSSPHVVPKPWSNDKNVDPEEAYIASIASCHMLSFLWVAMKQGFEIRSYRDNAVGTMTKNERGILWVSAVILHPQITYGTRAPTPAEEADLHHLAHEQCFIANSVKTEITVAPRHSI